MNIVNIPLGVEMMMSPAAAAGVLRPGGYMGVLAVADELAHLHMAHAQSIEWPFS